MANLKLKMKRKLCFKIWQTKRIKMLFGKRIQSFRLSKQANLERFGRLIELWQIRVSRLVHRIVATCFLPNPNNWLEVNHKDNDRTNNEVSNLEWCTRQYNIDYREKYGVPAKESAKVLREPLFAVNLKTFEDKDEITEEKILIKFLTINEAKLVATISATQTKKRLKRQRLNLVMR